jgi:hypothetical protein
MLPQKAVDVFGNAELTAMTMAAQRAVASQPSQLTGRKPQPIRFGPNQGSFVIIERLRLSWPWLATYMVTAAVFPITNPATSYRLQTHYSLFDDSPQRRGLRPVDRRAMGTSSGHSRSARNRVWQADARFLPLAGRLRSAPRLVPTFRHPANRRQTGIYIASPNYYNGGRRGAALRAPEGFEIPRMAGRGPAAPAGRTNPPGRARNSRTPFF